MRVSFVQLTASMDDSSTKHSGSGGSMRQKLRQAHDLAQKFTAPKARAAGRALSTASSEQTSETPSSAGSSFDADDSGTRDFFFVLLSDALAT